MTNLWKSVSFALTAMLVGSLVTTTVLTWPQGMHRDGALAQDVGSQDAGSQDAGSQDAGRGDAVSRLSGQPSGGAPLQQQDLTAALDMSTAFRNVAESMRPSVVSITTKAAPRRLRNIPPGLEGFFRGQLPSQSEKVGEGSGVIVREDGYILTNNHVVADADELIVETFDRVKHTGTVIGTDPKTDIAVVKIDAPDLRAVPFGDSDEIRVGDWVLAIGSPFGLAQTVTAGIISGKNRDQDIIDDGDGFEDFLQTDAAINPGNSGGPLVNLHGELVGINTAIVSRSGASAGIGFAIPVSLARPVLNSIIQTGKVHRGFLGASFGDIDEKAIKDFDLKVKTGALILSVLDGQPAALAGLQPGDVVTRIDGRPCRGSASMRNYVANRPPGTTIVLEVDRGGKPFRIEVSLKEMTPELMAKFTAIFGVELVPVTPESVKQYGLDDLRYGLIVVNIQDDSPLAETLQVGDVIERIGQVALTRVEDFHDLAQAAAKAGEVLPVVIRRGENRMLLRIR
jgi:serine protease Do